MKDHKIAGTGRMLYAAPDDLPIEGELPPLREFVTPNGHTFLGWDTEEVALVKAVGERDGKLAHTSAKLMRRSDWNIMAAADTARGEK